MTEEEAKTKWCPFARVDSDGAAGSNRYPEVEEDGTPSPPDSVVAGLTNTCIGSACMAWRWEREPNQPELLNWANGDMKARCPEATRISATIGFCGLAGQP